jgi:hypothetical protein
MNKIFFFLALFFCLCTIPSCTKKNCPNQCLNGGICDGVGCNCPDGYSGSSCEVKLDPCAGSQCGDHGHCILNAGNALCICDDGYEGTNCEKLWSEKFLGTFSVSEQCPFDVFDAKIIRDLHAQQITIQNFHNRTTTYNTQVKVVGVLFSPESFVIDKQPLDFGVPGHVFMVSGSGYYEQNTHKIVLNYKSVEFLSSTSTAIDSFECNAIFTPK